MIYVAQRREKNNVAFFLLNASDQCIIVGVTFRESAARGAISRASAA